MILFLLSITPIESTSISQLRGCSVTANVPGNTSRNFYFLEDFRANKNNKLSEDLVRISAWFTWKNPVLGFRGKTKEDMDHYYFGRYRENGFGIFRNYSDWLIDENPCSFVTDIDIFEKEPFVNVEISFDNGKYLTLI